MTEDLASNLYRLRDQIAELASRTEYVTDPAELTQMFTELALMTRQAEAIARQIAGEQQHPVRPSRLQPPPPEGPREHGNGGHDPAST